MFLCAIVTFADKILQFYRGLAIEESLPAGVAAMNPYTEADCFRVCTEFYQKYYNDNNTRHLILGINPGRFGAGVTGIPFTDPIKLETLFGIDNTLPKKPELSAEFIHRMIGAFGGYERFFSRFFINSVSPLGFVSGGKNLNYYDNPSLKASLTPFIIQSMRVMLEMGINRDVVYCLGEGANYKFVRQLNASEGWFNEVVPLAHPRFIMQYRRKHVAEYVQEYVKKLNGYRNKG